MFKAVEPDTPERPQKGLGENLEARDTDGLERRDSQRLEGSQGVSGFLEFCLSASSESPRPQTGRSHLPDMEVTPDLCWDSPSCPLVQEECDSGRLSPRKQKSGSSNADLNCR